MPGVDVIEVLRQFSTDSDLADICLCIISGRPELRQFLMDKFAGRCRAFVDKPYTPDEVVKVVSDLACAR